MRTLLMTALMAAVAMPALAVSQPASAQSRWEVERSRQELRREQRDLRDARRFGDRRDIQRERRDVREARRDLRQDRRDYRWGRDDWRGYRQGNRALYSRGNWRAPFAYQRFAPGARIAPGFYGQRYWVADPWRYRLPPAGRHQRWVRHYDDVVLIDHRRGRVVDVIRGFYW
jgi:Ni/Co efflux regulator RcnB